MAKTNHGYMSGNVGVKGPGSATLALLLPKYGALLCPDGNGGRIRSNLVALTARFDGMGFSAGMMLFGGRTPKVCLTRHPDQIWLYRRRVTPRGARCRIYE